MAEFLLDLFSLSLGGGAVILLLLLLERAAGLRYAARWRCLAWLLLCLRLAIPGPLLPELVDFGPAPIRVEVPADQVIYSYTPPAQPAEPAAPTGEPAGTPAEEGIRISLGQVLFSLWLLGGSPSWG